MVTFYIECQKIYINTTNIKEDFLNRKIMKNYSDEIHMYELYTTVKKDRKSRFEKLPLA